MRTQRFHELSWIDPCGRVFWEDGRLFRGIRASHAPFFRDLVQRGILDQLSAKKLFVDTRIVDRTTAEFPLIVEHRVLPVVSYASEWCGWQLKSAALVLLDLEIELRKHRLTLVDINPWNMLFDATQPLYVDLGSISEAKEPDEWPAHRQFQEFFVNPLRLHSIGMSRAARRMLYDPWHGVSNDEVWTLDGNGTRANGRSLSQQLTRVVKRVSPEGLLPVFRAAKRSLATNGHQADSKPALQVVRQSVAAMPIAPTRTSWGGYYNENFPEFTPSANWTAKHRSMLDILELTRPATVLDLGSNRGWYAQLAARHGARVIASDSDETSLNELCEDSRALNAAIHPVFMDVRFPTPNHGPALRTFADAATRFRSEMVFALALIHHLVYGTHLNFDLVVDTMSQFTEKWLAIEFVGPDDAVVRRWDYLKFPWYTQECFLAALSGRFDVVKLFPSDNGGLDAERSDRTIVLCRKKEAARHE